MQGKGGGPNTHGGKAVASRNALKHGLTSAEPVIDGVEDPAEWQRHLDGMIESLKPEGWHETVLAERIALFLWRARRATRYELAQTAAGVGTARRDLEELRRRAALQDGNSPDARALTEADVTFVQMMRMLPPEPEMARAMRFEAHVHRQYLQSLHELEAMQARRNGEPVPLARLDISGPPGV